MAIQATRDLAMAHPTRDRLDHFRLPWNEACDQRTTDEATDDPGLSAGDGGVGQQLLDGGSGDDTYVISANGGEHFVYEEFEQGEDWVLFENLNRNDVTASIDNTALLLEWAGGSARFFCQECSRLKQCPSSWTYVRSAARCRSALVPRMAL